jgi:hypothetical protein
MNDVNIPNDESKPNAQARNYGRWYCNKWANDGRAKTQNISACII